MKRTLPPQFESKRLPAPPPQRERTPTVYLFSTSARKKFYPPPQTQHNTLYTKPLHYTLFLKYPPHHTNEKERNDDGGEAPPKGIGHLQKSAYSCALPALRYLILKNTHSAIERDLHFWNASGCFKTKGFRRQIWQNEAISINGLFPRVREFRAPERISQKYSILRTRRGMKDGKQRMAFFWAAYSQ